MEKIPASANTSDKNVPLSIPDDTDSPTPLPDSAEDLADELAGKLSMFMTTKIEPLRNVRTKDSAFLLKVADAVDRISAESSKDCFRYHQSPPPKRPYRNGKHQNSPIMEEPTETVESTCSFSCQESLLTDIKEEYINTTTGPKSEDWPFIKILIDNFSDNEKNGNDVQREDSASQNNSYINDLPDP